MLSNIELIKNLKVYFIKKILEYCLILLKKLFYNWFGWFMQISVLSYKENWNIQCVAIHSFFLFFFSFYFYWRKINLSYNKYMFQIWKREFIELLLNHTWQLNKHGMLVWKVKNRRSNAPWKCDLTNFFHN